MKMEESNEAQMATAWPQQSRSKIEIYTIKRRKKILKKKISTRTTKIGEKNSHRQKTRI